MSTLFNFLDEYRNPRVLRYILYASLYEVKRFILLNNQVFFTVQRETITIYDSSKHSKSTNSTPPTSCTAHLWLYFWCFCTFRRSQQTSQPREMNLVTSVTSGKITTLWGKTRSRMINFFFTYERCRRHHSSIKMINGVVRKSM